MEEQNKYFKSGLRCAIRDVKKAPTADVVPKSEVARDFDDLKRYIILNENIAIKCKRENGEQNEEYWKGKISAFKQIRAYIDAELKNKYTESESVLGEYKFDEKIHTGPLDLSDAKFIDEDGNVTTLADWQDWDNKTPPSVIEGVTCTIDFPDGREIKNPSAEEVLEWANGTQIPVYIVEESEGER